MRKIKKIGTIWICLIMAVGFVMGAATFSCFIHRWKTGESNTVTAWFLKNTSLKLSWPMYLQKDVDVSPVNRYLYISDGVENCLEDLYTNCLPENGALMLPSQFYQTSILNNNVESLAGDNTNEKAAATAIDYLQEFNESLNKQGIPMVYVQLPSIDRIRESLGEDYNKNYLEIGDEFALQIKNTEIYFVNINEENNIIANASLDYTGHWYSKDSIAATKVLAGYLNDNCGFSIDTSIYDISLYTDVFDQAPQLKENIAKEYGYEYEYLVPNEDTQYSVNVGTYSDDIIEGNFAEAFLREPDGWGGANVYCGIPRITNGKPEQAKNLGKTNNDDKKILLLGDSYTWPMSAYLCQDVGEVYAFHPQYAPRCVSDVIKKYQPDVVIVAYCESQLIEELDENYGYLLR